MEVGLGIHGDPGAATSAVAPVDRIVARVQMLPFPSPFPALTGFSHVCVAGCLSDQNCDTRIAE